MQGVMASRAERDQILFGVLSGLSGETVGGGPRACRCRGSYRGWDGLAAEAAPPKTFQSLWVLG